MKANLLIVLLAASACGTAAPPPPTAATGGGAGGGAPPSSASAPRFLTLGTNVSSITAGESIRISAVLTDPDGIDDLIGGTLKSSDGARTYGSFASSDREGAYALELTWEQLNRSEPITFVGGGTRELVAEFFDAAGNRTAQTVSISLRCDPAAGRPDACNGECVGLKYGVFQGRNQPTLHCGTCGNSCSGEGSCDDGKCSEWSSCVAWPAPQHTCNAFCAAQGKTCTQDCRIQLLDGDHSGGGIYSMNGATCRDANSNQLHSQRCDFDFSTVRTSQFMCCCQ